MADQSIYLNFSVNTAPLGAAVASLGKVEAAASGVVRATDRTRGGFQGLSIVAFQAGQAVQDFAIGMEQGLGKALMFSINNISMLSTMLGAGAAFQVGMQVASTGVMLLAQNWEKLNSALQITPTTMAQATAALGSPLKAMADDAQRLAQAKNAIDAAGGMVGQLNADDRQKATDWTGRVGAIGADSIVGELARARRLGMSDEAFLQKFGAPSAVGGLVNSEADQFRDFAGDPGRQAAIVARVMKRVEDEIRQQLVLAGPDEGLQAGLIGDLARQNPELARRLKGENVKGQSSAIADSMDEAFAAARQQRSLAIQDNMDDALAAVLKGRQEEAKQLDERLRWERVKFEADQNIANERQRIQQAENDRAKAFANAAVDNANRGGINPFLLAMRMNEIQRAAGRRGFNESALGMGDLQEIEELTESNRESGISRRQARAMAIRQWRRANPGHFANAAQPALDDAAVRERVTKEVENNLLNAGRMGMGPILTQAEAAAQAKRMVDGAAPEAGFLADQMARANAMKPKEVQVMERLALAQEEALRKGVPMVLRRGGRR